MIKVILVGDYPIDDKIHTGIQGVLVNLTVEFLTRDIVELIIVSLSHNSDLTDYEKQCDTYKLNLRRSILKSKKDFYNIVKTKNPDIIHLQGVVPGVFLYNKKFKNSFVVTQHAILSKERLWQVSMFRKIKFLIKEIVENFYLSKMRNIIFISEYNKKVYLESRGRSIKANHELIPNPVNEVFNNKTHNNITSKNNELYFVGEIKKRKGLHIALHAIAILKQNNIQCKIHVIGGFKEKKYEREIKEIIKNSSLTSNVVFCGWMGQQEIMAYTKDIPIFLLPSFQETLPLSIAEAMCQKKLVIASDVGGISEMIEDNYSGFLFTAGDSIQLADVLQKIFLDPSIQKEVSKNAKLESEKYNAISIVDRTINFYSRTINLNKDQHNSIL